MSYGRDDMMRSRHLAGLVTRWHTWPMIRKPNTAEHHCRVAQIYCEIWGIPRGEILYYCLHHDSGEFTAGDVPFNAKSLSAGLRACMNDAEQIGRRRLAVVLPDLSDLEFKCFKICDLLEMWETAAVEVNMGNRYAEAPLKDTMEAAYEIARQIGELETIQSWIRGEHRADT